MVYNFIVLLKNYAQGKDVNAVEIIEKCIFLLNRADNLETIEELPSATKTFNNIAISLLRGSN